MDTKIIIPNKENYKFCGKLIRDGELVAFPTETVYGLGANALDEQAVRKIYVAKGRPSDNPLIVHISKPDEVYDLAAEIPEKAKTVIERFMPGSVTIVLPKKKIVPGVVTGGLDTVAIRMPSHPVALDFIAACGCPVCAPSANTSTRPSPTRAEHVYDDLRGKIAAVIDGGDCAVGVESTVIDFALGVPRLLRAGGMPLELLEEAIGPVDRSVSADKPLCPGMKYKHYAPVADVTVVRPDAAMIGTISDLYKKLAESGKKAAVLSLSAHLPEYAGMNVMDMGADSKAYAHNLFAALRLCDKQGYDAVIAEGVSEDGYGLSVMNRLTKAAGGKVL